MIIWQEIKPTFRNLNDYETVGFLKCWATTTQRYYYKFCPPKRGYFLTTFGLASRIQIHLNAAPHHVGI